LQRKALKRVALYLLLALLFAYAAVAAALFFSQTSIIFPTRFVPPARPLPRGAERLELVAADGVRLEGILIPPKRPRAGEKIAILGFAGNASNAAAIAEFLASIYPEHPVVGFHYRGYAPSGGTPSAAALLRDAPMIYDLVRDRLKPDGIVAVGISIGSGVAAGLAGRRPLDGLVLVTPFDSIRAVAKGQFSWLPVSLLIRHDLPSAAVLARSDVPVAIVAAERDRVIPPARTRALAGAVRNLVYDVTIPGRGHNDIAYDPRFQREMREALSRVLRR
jgi:pimeloyl-ACP methyl ester carboxylesterase